MRYGTGQTASGDWAEGVLTPVPGAAAPTVPAPAEGATPPADAAGN